MSNCRYKSNILEVCAYFPISRFAVIKHLNILEKAELIIRVREGKEKKLHVNNLPIKEIYRKWLSFYLKPENQQKFAEHKMSELKIKTVEENGTFEDIVSGAHAEVREIAYALRNLLAEIRPNITEVPWRRQKTAGYGIGPKKMSEHFCYLAPQKKYVSLGFMYGAELPDPEKLLEGNGKLLRHIKIRSREELSRPALKKLIAEASKYLPKLKKK